MSDKDLGELERDLPAIAKTGTDAIVAAGLCTPETVRLVASAVEIRPSMRHRS